MTILELREKRAKAWEAAKAFLDSHRNDKGILSAEDAFIVSMGIQKCLCGFPGFGALLAQFKNRHCGILL